ncbi:MAG: hypothetical protein J0H11_07135 [Rhizobiales bacterium]|nr:hypothetical protein [Hyphomicrobiales bacterium]
MTGRISRRHLLTLLAGVAGAATISAGAEEQKPSDRGIGGTGITSEPDAGAGGRIGFIGTIRRFGSIYVNDARISYPSDVAVWINGEKRSASALAIGQVARTVARRDAKDRLVTDRIDVLSEVIGPVSSIDKHAVTVLGQRVLLGDTIAPSDWVIGTRIAVFGLRTASGEIVATHVAPAGDWPDQIVGTPRMQGWTLRIGDLPLLGIGEQYEGWRVIVRGAASGRGFKVNRVSLDAPFEGRDVARISLETYVEHSGATFRTGAGFEFRDAELGQRLTPHENLRAVLNVEVGRTGELRLDGMRFEGPDGRLDGQGLRFGSGPGSSPPGGVSPPSGQPSIDGNMRGAVGLGSGPGGPAGGRDGPGPGGGHSPGGLGRGAIGGALGAAVAGSRGQDSDGGRPSKPSSPDSGPR